MSPPTPKSHRSSVMTSVLSRVLANLPNWYSALCWRPVAHAQTWASYNALFGRLSPVFNRSKPFLTFLIFMISASTLTVDISQKVLLRQIFQIGTVRYAEGLWASYSALYRFGRLSVINKRCARAGHVNQPHAYNVCGQYGHCLWPICFPPFNTDGFRNSLNPEVKDTIFKRISCRSLYIPYFRAQSLWSKHTRHWLIGVNWRLRRIWAIFHCCWDSNTGYTNDESHIRLSCISPTCSTHAAYLHLRRDLLDICGK